MQRSVIRAADPERLPVHEAMRETLDAPERVADVASDDTTCSIARILFSSSAATDSSRMRLSMSPASSEHDPHTAQPIGLSS